MGKGEPTDKRTDASWDKFITRKINSGLARKPIFIGKLVKKGFWALTAEYNNVFNS